MTISLTEVDSISEEIVFTDIAIQLCILLSTTHAPTGSCKTFDVVMCGMQWTRKGVLRDAVMSGTLEPSLTISLVPGKWNSGEQIPSCGARAITYWVWDLRNGGSGRGAKAAKVNRHKPFD
jgi:hypothetical protein